MKDTDVTDPSEYDGVKEEILRILEALGGEVRDDDGRAVRKIFERVSRTGTYSTVSTAIGELETDGVLYRDQPNLKRTTRVALAREGVRPGRKSLDVVMEKMSRSMAETVRHEISAVIDAHVAAELETRGTSPERVAELEEAIDLLKLELKDAKKRLRDAQTEPTRLRAELDQVKRDLEHEREQRRIAEHNAEVYKRHARSASRQMSDTIDKVGDRLRPDERRSLEKMIRETPKG